ncbi:hypothetical protein AKJ57_03635 [candidate division MSBL1 archaeon SCGC-AAA259A05]|uniref:ArnR1-like winged helix-turn-helix domain-containing protein n=1 Tax=candidate division MSBL1 archaeon SCGC-AAA259A05 TaxID=1698259 RepID=A0A133U9B4_9EURY|nr:hypothetical protein AKJ57_03635 [candidate division MSBL1 archaeon SCGC-AAA259A05]
MKLSNQMKKILLALKDEKEENDKVVSGLNVETIATKIEGESVLYRPSWSNKDQLKNKKSVSYRRSLKRLCEEGLVNESTDYVTNRYSLSPKGGEKAEELRTEIQNYVNEWNRFL